MPASQEWRPVSWTLAALALILATYANPIFVRKIVLMANPDTATSVVLAYLGIVAWQLMERLRVPDNRILPWALQFSFSRLTLRQYEATKSGNLNHLVCQYGSRIIIWTAEIMAKVGALDPALLLPAIISYGLWRYF